jgi:GNAT superfamily N-acetyltransferase
MSFARPWLRARWHKSAEISRNEGLLRLLFRVCRKCLSPLVLIDVFYFFSRDLTKSSIPDTHLPEGLRMDVQDSVLHLAQLEALFAPMGRNRGIRPRLERGDVVILAFAGAPLVGFTWIAFADVFESALGVTVRVPPRHFYVYDSYVQPEWRGQRLQAALAHAAYDLAQTRGCQHSLAYISVLNWQSLRLTQRWNSPRVMVLINFLFRGAKRPLPLTFGKSLVSRLLESPAEKCA